MNNEMKVLMEGWRRFINEESDPKNPELKLPKGPNSAGLNEDDLEEGHEPDADPKVAQPNHELDGSGYDLP